MAIMMDEFLTVEEVAKKLRMSEETVKRLLRTKQMAGYKISGVWRITTQDLMDFIVKQRNIQEDNN